MIFPHEDHIITLNQLTHSKKRPLTNTDVILPYVDTIFDALTWYQKYGLNQFKPSSILGSFLGDPPVIPESSLDVIGAPVCIVSSSRTKASQDRGMSNNDIDFSAMVASLAYTASQTPFLFPPAGLVSQ